GNIYKLDPVGVVRSALMRFGYQLETAWSLWGTMSPELVSAFDKLLFDVTEGISLSKNRLSEILYGDKYYLGKQAKNNEELATESFKLLLEILNLNDNDPRFRKEDIRKLKEEKAYVIYKTLISNLLKGQSAVLFETLYNELFGTIHTYSKDESFVIFEIIRTMGNLLGKDHALRVISQKSSWFNSFQRNVRRNKIEQFCIDIWGKSYITLLMEPLRTKYLQSSSIKELNNKIGADLDWNVLMKLVGIVEGTIIEVDKDGNVLNNPENILFWLSFGTHNYFRDSGHGLEHIFQNHKEDFKNTFGLEDPKEIAEFILETMKDKVGFYDRINGEIGYRVKDKYGKTRYLIVGFDENGRIHSSYPADRINLINKYQNRDLGLRQTNYLGDLF
ncbi:MAG: hypothetical protein ACFFG0_40585, partial [Candidatus Thorarchaeota archaeon]